jgi:ubiquinone/menaquinone biosynthesis C-methylase UbiE
MPIDFSANIERFSGFAGQYDDYRPQPPTVIVDILTQLAQTMRPRLVVDLGCGTGLSTRLWADRADEVVGVDPSNDMRREAEQRTQAANVRYQAGLSTETNLAEGCADIVTCSQSLHWMEPEGTFAEVARILRPGGVFAAYDCDWPPTVGWKAEAAYMEVMRRATAIDQERSYSPGLKSWRKDQHLERMQASGHFRYVKEITLHHVELGNAERLVGLAMSQGHVATLLKNGLSEAEIGLDKLRDVATQTLGEEMSTWYFSYRVRLGIK